MNCLLALFFTLAVASASELDDVVVQLPYGKIRGQVLKSYVGKPYYAFQEVPYATPPIGENRFQLPKQPKPWDGILNTTKNTLKCYQSNTLYPNLKISEDCLYLNVYSPVKPGSTELLPVYFWIHGGAYVEGAGTFEYFGPQHFMDLGEFVVVTINYRLGVFGFLTTEDDVIPGNLAFKDQRFAMKWVHENIGLFGGNKSAVTLGGQSAGAGSVSYHLLGKWGKSEELFHAAILHSGHSLWTSFQNRGKPAALELGKKLSSNFSSQDSKELLSILQKASAADILKTRVQGDYGPIIEKQGDFSNPMLQSYMSGNFKRIPTIIGFNSEEWINQGRNNVSGRGKAMDNNPSLFINKAINMSDGNRTLAGQLLKHIYTNSSFEEDIGAFVRYSSDSMFSIPIMKIAELECPHKDIYVYRFAYKGPLGQHMDAPVIPGADRVAHGEDLHYMWRHGANKSLSEYPLEDQKTFHRFTRLWANFIKYHNPTPVKDPLLQDIIWPKLENSTNIVTNFLNINVTLEIQQNPRNYKQNKEVIDKYILPPYIYY